MVNDNLVPTATLPSTLFYAIPYAPGVGEVGGGPAFEMLSYCPKSQSQTVTERALTLDFLITGVNTR